MKLCALVVLFLCALFTLAVGRRNHKHKNDESVRALLKEVEHELQRRHEAKEVDEEEMENVDKKAFSRERRQETTTEKPKMGKGKMKQKMWEIINKLKEEEKEEKAKRHDKEESNYRLKTRHHLSRRGWRCTMSRAVRDPLCKLECYRKDCEGLSAWYNCDTEYCVCKNTEDEKCRKLKP